MVVQINGKKKLLLEVPSDAEQNEVMKIISMNPNIDINLTTSTKKIIFIKNKIINFVR